jgi:hypothetical protein
VFTTRCRSGKKHKEIYSDGGVTMDDGSTNHNVEAVLDKWKQSFEELLNPVCHTVPGEAPQVEAIKQNDDDILNGEKTPDEVEDAIQAMKLNKAAGADDLNKCFQTGVTPDMWRRGIINHIQKSTTADLRDPLGYRGITLTPVIYNMYSNIPNRRISRW